MFDPYLEWLKIPADRRPPTHYELLGLPAFESDASRIHAAAMERMALVRRYQLGDRSDLAIRLLGELSSAFDCVSDPARRNAYDERLRGAGDNASPASPPLLPRRCPSIHRARLSARGPALLAAITGNLAGRCSAGRIGGASPLVWFSSARHRSAAITTQSRRRGRRELLTSLCPSMHADDKEPAAPAKRDPQIRFFGYATAGPPGSSRKLLVIRTWSWCAIGWTIATK